MPKQKNNELIDAHWYFGGIASAFAVCFTHPIDLIRVQIQSQLQYVSAKDATRMIVKQRGSIGMYYGIGIAMHRQVTSSLMRFGLYDTAKRRHLIDSFKQKVEIAAASGLLTGFFSAPMEKVNLRTQTDAARPPEQRRNYTNVANGIRRMYADGGIHNLFTAALPSAIRGMCLNVVQLSFYDQIKIMLISTDSYFSDNWETFLIASMISGGIATIITTPIDVVKVIRMNADASAFRNNREVIRSLVRLHGYRGFYKGLVPSCFRIVPQTILTFLIYEELRLNFGIR